MLLIGNNVFSQEICDNGIDDDGDGLIDLQDPDCQCHWNAPVNLLSNASFEDYYHCLTPGAPYLENYNILKDWLFGVEPNGDIAFYHNLKCPDDSLEFTVNYVPRPIPDGNGFLLMIRGTIQSILSNTPESTVKKYYVAQCLKTPLIKGTDYTFSFYGAQYSNTGVRKLARDSFHVAVFGNTDCNAVPFGQQARGNGCPSDHPGWIMLGKTTFISSLDWVQAKMKLTIPENINVIEVGDDCSLVDMGDTSFGGNAAAKPYYYLDKFELAETKDFHFQYIQLLSGDPCNGGYILKAPTDVGATYQWYKDSIALVGQTDSILHISDSFKTAYYNVRITKGDQCQVSEPLLLNRTLLNSIEFPTDTISCVGQTLHLGQVIPGVSYSWNGISDSIVSLTKSGQYSISVSDNFGCHKNFLVKADFKNCVLCPVYIPNAFTPNDDGLNDVLKPKINCPVTDYYLTIYNRWGQKVFESRQPEKGWDGKYLGKKLPIGVYIYFIQYKNFISETKYKIAKGTVTVIR